MTDYISIGDSEVDSDAPLTSWLGYRFRDNPVAMFEGAPGAPRLQGLAVGRPGAGGGLPVLTVSAADSYEILNNCGATTNGIGGSTTSTSNVSVWLATILSFTGTIRFKAIQTRDVSTSNGTIELFKNGVLLVSYTVSASGQTQRSYDAAAAPGDVFEWRARQGTGGNSGATQCRMWASDAYSENIPLVRSSQKTG